jgi:Effector Associated Constant Component 1
MRLDLSIAGTPTPAIDLDSIAELLLREPDLRGSAVVRSPAPAPEGALGALTDTLTVAIGSGGIAVTLIQLVGGWLNSRGSDASVTVKNGDSCVTITLSRVRDPKLYRQLLVDARELLRDDPPA